MNRIILVGNGFDLAHNLPTKYEDFINWYSRERLKGFENKGYFELHALVNGKTVLIDRHSRKADLVKIKELLSRV